MNLQQLDVAISKVTTIIKVNLKSTSRTGFRKPTSEWAFDGFWQREPAKVGGI